MTPQDTDYSGFDFWLTKLNEFNGNFVDADMVKAFISSSEYRQRFWPLKSSTALIQGTLIIAHCSLDTWRPRRD
jgi:hypothetical protein